MKTLLLVALLALSAVPLVPTAAADACVGRPQAAAVCHTWNGHYECYQVWILGQERPELGFCIV